MKHITLVLLIVLSYPAFAQTKKTDDAKTKDKTIFMFVEQMPEFNGDMHKYISEHLKYPKEARKNNIEGRVMVKFMVNDDGSISDVQTIRPVHPSLDKEAERLVKGMPKWNPGKQNGKAVNVWLNLPISFRLESAELEKK